MRGHVGEGEMHAYLDGELDAVLGDAACAVREHLVGCPLCRMRLDEEAGLRAAADAVLAGALPPAAPPPPLESLKDRAQGEDGPTSSASGGRRTRRRRMASLAWAASVAVALGLGWSVRDRIGSAVAADPAYAPASESAGAAAESALAQAPTAADGPGAGAVVRASSTTASAGSETEAAPSGGGPAPAPEGSAEGPSAAARLASAPPDAPTLPDPSLPDAVGKRIAVTLPALSSPAAAQEDHAPRDHAGTTTRDAGAGLPRVAFRAAMSETAGLGGGPQALLPAGLEPVHHGRPAPPVSVAGPAQPLTVPGLPLLTVVGGDVAPGVKGVRVLQRLPSSDTLELVVVPGGPDARGGEDALDAVLAEPLPTGWSRVVRVRSAGWVIALAPLSAAELSGLVEGVGGP